MEQARSFLVTATWQRQSWCPCLLQIPVLSTCFFSWIVSQSIRMEYNCWLQIFNFTLPWVITFEFSLFLTLSRRMPLPYRNQSIDLWSKSMDWFLYDNGLRLEKGKVIFIKKSTNYKIYIYTRHSESANLSLNFRYIRTRKCWPLKRLIVLTSSTRAHEKCSLNKDFLMKLPTHTFHFSKITKTARHGELRPSLELTNFSGKNLCVCHRIDVYLERTKAWRKIKGTFYLVL